MIGIVDYGLGNLASVAGAVRKVGYQPVVAADPDVLESCDRLILPGVGAFGDGMRNLRERNLVAPLTDMVRRRRKPILGICLGFQLMAKSSEEFGTHEGLGWFDAVVVRLRPSDKSLRVPHVGWNGLTIARPDCPLFEGVGADALFYYVHTYCMQANEPAIVAAHCEYGQSFAVALQDENVFATQFHPEKSQKHGLRLLQNFLERT